MHLQSVICDNIALMSVRYRMFQIPCIDPTNTISVITNAQVFYVLFTGYSPICFGHLCDLLQGDINKNTVTLTNASEPLMVEWF